MNLRQISSTDTVQKVVNDYNLNMQDIQANASLLDITATFTNGSVNIPAATLGVNNVAARKWIVQAVTTGDDGVPTVASIRLYSTVLTVYLRTHSGDMPPDGDYRLFIYRD